MKIQNPPQRYAVIDTRALLELLAASRYEQYQQLHQGWIEEALKVEDNQGRIAWT